jgi:drug/metabolite transporter (DMT)-like permease
VSAPARPASVTSPGASQAGLFAVVTAIVIFSLGSTFVRKAGAPGVIVAFWRLAVGTLIWQVILVVQGRRLTTADIRRAAPVGVLFGINLALFFVAATRTRIANVEFIASLTPVVVVPIAAVVFHERIRRRALLWGLGAAAGVALLLFGAPSTGEQSWAGDLYALGAVFAWAGYLLVSRRVRATMGTSEVMAVTALVATVVLLPFAVLRGGMFSVSAEGWAYILSLAILTGTVGHGLIMWSQRRVPVSTIAILGLAQPALATTWAYFLLDETVEPIQIVGMAIVLVSLGAFTITSNRGSAPPGT